MRVAAGCLSFGLYRVGRERSGQHSSIRRTFNVLAGSLCMLPPMFLVEVPNAGFPGFPYKINVRINVRESQCVPVRLRLRMLTCVCDVYCVKVHFKKSIIRNP